MYTLIIGDKAYSSWSLRGWLLLAGFGLPFRERLAPMYDPGFERLAAEHAPARTVPQLEWQEAGRTHRIWDSAAIAETLAERHPEAGIWPADPWARAVARTVAAEMHSGFAVLRSACPMNLHREARPLAEPPGDLARDLDRLGELWAWARREAGGPWLGGAEFSAADAFYAPVAFRLRSYALTTPETEPYVTAVLSHEAVERWRADAVADPRRLTLYDRD